MDSNSINIGQQSLEHFKGIDADGNKTSEFNADGKLQKLSSSGRKISLLKEEVSCKLKGKSDKFADNMQKRTQLSDRRVSILTDKGMPVENKVKQLNVLHQTASKATKSSGLQSQTKKDIQILLKNQIKKINSPEKMESTAKLLTKLHKDGQINEKTVSKLNVAIDKQSGLIIHKMKSQLDIKKLDKNDQNSLEIFSNRCLTAKAWLDTLHSVSPDRNAHYKEEIASMITKIYQKAPTRLYGEKNLHEMTTVYDKVSTLTTSLKESIVNSTQDKSNSYLKKINESESKYLKPIRKVISNIMDTTLSYCNIKDKKQELTTSVSSVVADININKEKIANNEKELKGLKKRKADNREAKKAINKEIKELKEENKILQETYKEEKKKLGNVEKKLGKISSKLDKIIDDYKWGLTAIDTFAKLKVEGGFPSKDDLENAMNKEDKLEGLPDVNLEQDLWASGGEIQFQDTPNKPSFSSFLDKEDRQSIASDGAVEDESWDEDEFDTVGEDIVRIHEALLKNNPSITEDQLTDLKNTFDELLEKDFTPSELDALLGAFAELLTPDETGNYWHFNIANEALDYVIDNWNEGTTTDNAIDMLYEQMTLNPEKLIQKNDIAVALQETVEGKKPPTT